MTGDYLVELRSRLIKVAIVFGIGLTLGFLFSNKIIVTCLRLFNFTGVNVVMTSPAQLIDLQLYTAIISGILLAVPILIGQILAFVRPAFSKKEFWWVTKILPIGSGLFVAGTVFGAWVTQFIVVIYSKYSADFRVNNIWDIQKFFLQVIVTAILMGFIFQLPLVMSILIRSGLVAKEVFAKNRRNVYALLMVIAVLLPPTDILSLVMLTTPLLFLFEIGLLLNVGQT